MKLKHETKNLYNELNKRKHEISLLNDNAEKLHRGSYNYKMAARRFAEQLRKEREQADMEKNKGFSFFNFFTKNKKSDEEMNKIKEEQNNIELDEIKENEAIHHNKKKLKKKKKFIKTKDYIDDESFEVNELENENNGNGLRDELMNKSLCIQGCNIF